MAQRFFFNFQNNLNVAKASNADRLSMFFSCESVKHRQRGVVGNGVQAKEHSNGKQTTIEEKSDYSLIS